MSTIDKRRLGERATEAATASRSVVVEVNAISVTNPSTVSHGLLYEWITRVSIDPILVHDEGINIVDTIAKVTAAAFEAFS